MKQRGVISTNTSDQATRLFGDFAAMPVPLAATVESTLTQDERVGEGGSRHRNHESPSLQMRKERSDKDQGYLVASTVDIVAAHVKGNVVSPADLPKMIQDIYSALSGLGCDSTDPAVKLCPAVPIRSSVKADYIICLEDGKKLKLLKRYLIRRFGMTPEQYREKWNLPSNYPMTAPNYSKARSDMAKEVGLGTRDRTKIDHR